MIMKRFAALCLVAGIAACSPPTIDGGRYGQVRFFKPEGAIRGFVVMFSDAGGWTSANDEAARALARRAAMVVGVDTKAYLQNLSRDSEPRLYLAADVGVISQQLERQAGNSNYQTPVLAGIGEGGALAELILAQAPPHTIAGAVSIDPTAGVATDHPFAAGPPARPHYHENLDLSGGLELPGFWSVGMTPAGPADGRDRVERLRQDGMSIDLHELAASQTQGAALAALTEAHLQPAPGASPLRAALPLVELPVSLPRDVLAIVLSGDGGWADLDKVIGEDLQRDGVPVVGWDSLRYFWSLKTPDQLAGTLATVMSTYMERWHAAKVVLIGYSFGADVLPFAYNRLPQELRRHVILMTLLGPEKRANFEIKVSGWLNLPPGDDAAPIAPEIDKIQPQLIECYYGEEEKHSACPDLAAKGIKVVQISGAHHFDGDYRGLEKQILAALSKRTDRDGPRQGDLPGQSTIERYASVSAISP
jgi:type IV secretory pathway VirJ component